MSEYIKREDAVKAIKRCESGESYDFNNGLIVAMNAIDDCPAADVVERRAVIEAMMNASTPAFDEDGKPTFLVDYVKVMESL